MLCRKPVRNSASRSLRSSAVFVYILVLICVYTSAGCSREAAPVQINVDAKAAMMIEAGNGKVLFAKNPDGSFPPASTAKVMTAIVAIERVPVTKEMTVSRKAVRIAPTVAGLRPGVKYRLKDLIAAILIKSANDAAMVIAEEVAGSEKEFVLLMNATAKELGMTDTYFATATGLPTGKKDRQHTTARDLVRMMRYALRYRIILEAMSRKEEDIYGGDGQKIHLETHNKALLRYSKAPWGKTGYTRQARRTFVGVNPSLKPRIIFALLRSDDLWDDITTLNDQGLRIYRRNHWMFISELVEWIKDQRRKAAKDLS
jgi:D-alanyl-D-alanine carboxypeptidase (penicillin-binding protein 5/6)